MSYFRHFASKRWHFEIELNTIHATIQLTCCTSLSYFNFAEIFRENDTKQNPGLQDSMECHLEAQTIWQWQVSWEKNRAILPLLLTLRSKDRRIIWILIYQQKLNDDENFAILVFDVVFEDWLHCGGERINWTASIVMQKFVSRYD